MVNEFKFDGVLIKKEIKTTKSNKEFAIFSLKNINNFTDYNHEPKTIETICDKFQAWSKDLIETIKNANEGDILTVTSKATSFANDKGYINNSFTASHISVSANKNKKENKPNRDPEDDGEIPF